MKKRLPFILIIASVILMIAITVITEAFDKSFWMSMLSSVLLIIAMVLTIRSQNKTQ